MANLLLRSGLSLFSGTWKAFNLYFKVLKVLFTTRLQDEYLDDTSKEKYTVKNIIIYKNNTDTEEYKSIDDMKNNITDTDNIIIKCGTPSRINHVWVYVTNKNWGKITELIKSYTIDSY